MPVRTWEVKWAEEEGYVHIEVEPSIQTLKTDPSPDKRKEAAWLLGRVRTFQSIIPLIEALDDASPVVQKEAAKALQNIAQNEKIADKENLLTLFQDLQNEDMAVKAGAIATLNKMAVQFATKYLRSNYSYYRRMGINELVSLGKEAQAALSDLVQVLEDEDFFVRKGAIEALGKIGESQVLSYLEQTLRDENRHIRLTTIRALAEVDSIQVIPLLQTALQDKEEVVREEAATVLNRLVQVSSVANDTTEVKEESHKRGLLSWLAS